MDARLQLRVQRYGWDLAAPHYERAWNDALAPATRAVLEAAKLESGERVLDVACGGGVLARAAWEAVAPGGEVVGSDISETMLVEAAAALPQCSFVRADAQALDRHVPLAHFDAVAARPGPRGSSEARRPRDPGGRSAAIREG